MTSIYIEINLFIAEECCGDLGQFTIWHSFVSDTTKPGMIPGAPASVMLHLMDEKNGKLSGGVQIIINAVDLEG